MNNKSNSGLDLRIIQKAIRLTANGENYVQVKIFDAIVQAGSQDEDNLTCVVDSVDGNINDLEVRYMLCVSDGEISVPEDDSLVTIAMTCFTDPYIVEYTELKEKDVIVKDTEILQKDGEISISQGFNSSGLDGIKAKFSNNKFSLKNDLQDFTSILNDILTQIQTIAQNLITPANILTPSGNGQFEPVTVTNITNALTSITEDITKINQILQ